jgi:hypothetical protein
MKTFRLAMAVASALAVPLASEAAFFSIDDSAADETITVSANDFEAGLIINGAPFQSGLGSPATATADEAAIAGTITFSGSWIDLGFTTPGSRTVYFLEPGSGETSDILQMNYGTDGFFGHLEGSFISDTGLPLPPPPVGAETIVESKDFSDFSLPFLSFQVRSDVKATPDGGSTLGLLALAFGAIGTARKLRR